MKNKFRAWHPKAKKMFYPSEELCGSRDEGYLHIEHSFEENNKLDYKFLPSELILLQYTGLKDKSGKEIYEGDILAPQHYGGEVIWYEGGFALHNYHCGACPFPDNKTELEIIGNMFEQPELFQNEPL